MVFWYGILPKNQKYFARKMTGHPPPPKKITALPPKITGPLQIAPFAPPLWATLLVTTFFRLFNGLVVTVIPSLDLLEPLVFLLGVILVATVRCILNLFSCTPSVCSDGFADLLADCRCRPNALQEDLD